MFRQAHRALTLLALLAMAGGSSGCTVGAKSTSIIKVLATGREPREIYEHGEKMMRQGLYDKAIADFQELRNFHRDDPLSVRAQLALAEIQYRKREWEEARYAFEDFATYHPRHPDLDYVTYMTGLTIWKQAPLAAGRDQGTTRDAVNRWYGFSSRFPESEYTEEVDKFLLKGLNRLAMKELWVARFYKKRDAWGGVKGRAETVLRRYAASERAEEALALLARAFHEIGQVSDALEARDKLAAAYPDSHWLRSVNRTLAKAPGTPPEEEIFFRPLRIPGMNTPMPPGQ